MLIVHKVLTISRSCLCLLCKVHDLMVFKNKHCSCLWWAAVVGCWRKLKGRKLNTQRRGVVMYDCEWMLLWNERKNINTRLEAKLEREKQEFHERLLRNRLDIDDGVEGKAKRDETKVWRNRSNQTGASWSRFTRETRRKRETIARFNPQRMRVSCKQRCVSYTVIWCGALACPERACAGSILLRAQRCIVNTHENSSK